MLIVAMSALIISFGSANVVKNVQIMRTDKIKIQNLENERGSLEVELKNLQDSNSDKDKQLQDYKQKENDLLKQIEELKISKTKQQNAWSFSATAKAQASIPSGWHYQCVSQTDAVHKAVIDAGLDSQWVYINYIFSHESCNDPGRLNSLNCAGLGQRCPGSTLWNACGANDIPCQVNHFNVYAIGRYKSWYGAYLFWKQNHWW